MPFKNRLPHNIFLLGLVSMFNGAGGEIVQAVLPLFVASLGAGGLAIGLIGSIGDAATSGSQVLAGWWSDKIGKRKPFLWVGYGLSGLMRLVMSASVSWPQVFIARPVERLGKLRDAPRDALVADSVPKEIRGEAFGIQRAFDGAGGVIGSVLALALVALGLAFQPIIAIGGLISLSSLGAIFMVREVGKKPVTRGLIKSLHDMPKEFRLYLMISTLFAFGNFTYFFFIVKASSMFSGTMALIAPIGMYVVFNIVSTIASPFVGKFSDKVGRKRMLISGYLLFAAVCIGFAINGEIFGLIALFGLYGVFNALIDGSQRAFACDLVSEKERGTSLGAFHTAVALTALPSGIAAGLLYTIAPAMTFWWGALMGLISAILLLTIIDNR